MKKLAILFTILLFLSFDSFAQSRTRSSSSRSSEVKRSSSSNARKSVKPSGSVSRSSSSSSRSSSYSPSRNSGNSRSLQRNSNNSSNNRSIKRSSNSRSSSSYQRSSGSRSNSSYQRSSGSRNNSSYQRSSSSRSGSGSQNTVQRSQSSSNRSGIQRSGSNSRVGDGNSSRTRSSRYNSRSSNQGRSGVSRSRDSYSNSRGNSSSRDAYRGNNGRGQQNISRERTYSTRTRASRNSGPSRIVRTRGVTYKKEVHIVRERRVIHHYVNPPRPISYRRVYRAYRVPNLVYVNWSINLFNDFRVFYPRVVHWHYRYGDRIRNISAYDAMYFIGEVKRVYGKVSEVYYSRNDDMYYLYVGARFPYHDFSILIPGREYRRYDFPSLRHLEFQHVWVMGLITEYDNKPEIVIKRPYQLGIY